MDLKTQMLFLVMVNSADLTFVIEKKIQKKEEKKRCSFPKGLTGLI